MGLRLPGPNADPVSLSCRVPGLDEVLALLAGGLVGAPAGAELCELQEAVGMELGVDLEQLGRDLGYASAKDFLTHVPGLQLQDPERGSHCVVQLQRGRRGLVSICLSVLFSAVVKALLGLQLDMQGRHGYSTYQAFSSGQKVELG